ncbi:hypothetical protein [Streptosporangium roseum]|uniref:hypothetical protein n=1 Tax=Streptosporangium roseum TaxID=2001 RepID=UPI0012DFBF48|nr:hypothetical protein [Streptosporangium roseum]
MSVVDGGQRLATLRDFIQGKIVVDGKLTPVDQVLREIDGLHYAELPSGLRTAFNDYPLLVVELHDLPGGDIRPALFRLNDDERLTPAQRMMRESGDLGEQVHHLVAEAADWGMDGARLGFSNAALGYDDVVTRALLAVERADIRAAAHDVDHRVKEGQLVDAAVREEVAQALRALLSMSAMDEPGVRFSKASLLSWLLVLVHATHRFGAGASHYLGAVMEWFEPQRRRLKAGLEVTTPPLRRAHRSLAYKDLLSVFNEAAAIDALSVESIVQRDAILWLLLMGMGGIPSLKTEPAPFLSAIRDRLAEHDEPGEVLATLAHDPAWGRWS